MRTRWRRSSGCGLRNRRRFDVIKIIKKLVDTRSGLGNTESAMKNLNETNKTPRQAWKLKSGLLYAGIAPSGLAVLTSEDKAEKFDSRDNPEIKSAFYSALLGCKMEIVTA